MQESNNPKEKIAIIGIGCRFPGGVINPETFWQLLINGTDAIAEVPEDRFDINNLYDPEQGKSGKIITRSGGFLDAIDQFDASFFDISPRETECLDPQQRLLLEVSWEALEDAGLNVDTLAGSRTGVFTGMWTGDYEHLLYGSTSDTDLYMTTGGGRYSAAGRISYLLDLQGPSMTVDTACSSSLVSVHLACQSLILGESDLAFAGGVNLIMHPAISVAYSNAGMLSPDGRCKFGDASANGYVRSEGCGMLVLKRLSSALADKDTIYALIVGSAVNHDEYEGFFEAPNQIEWDQIPFEIPRAMRAGVDSYATTGSVRYELAERLSFYYGLQRPIIEVDIHCYSSLVAAHLACQGLLMKENDFAPLGCNRK